MGSWKLPGPDALTLSREEVASLLRISVDTLDRMVRDGRFPRGLRTGTQTAPIWTGADLAAWMHLHERMQPEEPAKKSPRNLSEQES